MIYIQYLVRPTALNDRFGSVGGAFSSCYINVVDVARAEAIATGIITTNHWQIVHREELRILDRSECTGEYALQALTDDEVIVFHTWPIDDADDEKDG